VIDVFDEREHHVILGEMRNQLDRMVPRHIGILDAL